MKLYINNRTQDYTFKATEAIVWHRAGDEVRVLNCNTISFVDVPGADPVKKERNAAEENRRQCKHIAREIEAYADGNVYHCPECGEEIRMPDDVGDKFKCPYCGEVNDVDDFEQLSIWDYMTDILDIEYRCGSDRDYRSCKIMVACGGPNIYIDTASAMVKLYWWSEYAEFPLSYSTRDAIDEWAEEYWNM